MAFSLKSFEEARNYLEKTVVDSLTNLEIGIYDPWLKYIFERELKRNIQNHLKKKYPDVMVNFSFSIYISSQTIEYSVQNYYHPYSMHIYLGSVRDPKKTRDDSEPFLVDCYYSSLYEPFGEPRIIVRYGHGKKEYEEGATSAAEQFYSGLDTVLAKGYQLAMEAGYIR